MHAIYKTLNDVKWAPSGSTSRLLSDSGFKHGFVGRAAPKPAGLHHVKQVHGIRVVEAHGSASGLGAASPDEADGVWTSLVGIPVSVKTADCLPVLLGDPAQRHVMAVHAGWRGLSAGILGQAIKQFLTLGSPPGELVAAIGPAASRERYEVGAEVIDALFTGRIALHTAQAALAIAKGKNDRWHLDLKVAAVFDLLNHGLRPGRIEVIQACTMSDTSWHSFRREGPGCGSNWSWIAL